MSYETNWQKTVSFGPWGGVDGFHWSDGVYSSVRQLEIGHGSGIDSIRIEYDKNGASTWSEKHGGSGGIKINQVKLEYPDEYLTSIHGYYGNLQEWGPVFIRSITFESNKGTYGPYGIEQGTHFSFPTVMGKIVGFHGRCSWYLDAIGVYLEPITIPSNSMVCSQNSVVNGTEKFGYSIIQGSLGKNYDLVVALRHKDDYSNSLQNNLSRQTSSSSEFSYTEPKNSKVFDVPATIERVPSKNVKRVVTCGTWGGSGGTVFDDGIYDGVKQINLSRNLGIASIRVCYIQNGNPVWESKNGGTGGFKSDIIMFDYPSEILTHITGYHGPTMLMGPNIIKSLTFHTTKTNHGPFGEEQGHAFSTNLREGKIVGFHGRKGLFIDAIGVHVVEGKVVPSWSSPSNSFNQNVVKGKKVNQVDSSKKFVKLGKKGLTKEVVQKVVKDPAPYGPGPWGGEGGKQWDDGVFTGIKQLVLNRSAEAICSIEIEYDRNGQSLWSVKHGGNSGQTSQQIKLEYPDEVLTCISGYYGPIYKDEEGTRSVVKSLTFQTSRRKCGPFGEEFGTYFTSTTTEGKVVGFHGRSSLFLDAIGVHMQHWLGNQRSISKPSSLTKFFF